jgi:hypothetical protein
MQYEVLKGKLLEYSVCFQVESERYSWEIFYAAGKWTSVSFIFNIEIRFNRLIEEEEV